MKMTLSLQEVAGVWKEGESRANQNHCKSKCCLLIGRPLRLADTHSTVKGRKMAGNAGDSPLINKVTRSFTMNPNQPFEVIIYGYVFPSR